MHTNQSEYHSALHDFLVQQDFRYHLTFTFNRPITFQAARDKLRFWTARTMRRLWGRQFYKRDPQSTLFYFAFPEYGADGDNLHFHVLVRIDPTRHRDFRRVAQAEWRQVMPSGTLFFQLIGSTTDDINAVVAYDLKDLSRSRDFIISTEFSPTPGPTGFRALSDAA